jgi:hypothetical protein
MFREPPIGVGPLNLYISIPRSYIKIRICRGRLDAQPFPSQAENGGRVPLADGVGCPPLGDNMMTGTVGLFEALRRRKKLDPIFYV